MILKSNTLVDSYTESFEVVGFQNFWIIRILDFLNDWLFHTLCIHDLSCQARHITTHCNTLQQTAIDCNTLQHAATQCNRLQHTATHCNTLQHTAIDCNTLQHTATHCSTLQHAATRCNTLQHAASEISRAKHAFAQNLGRLWLLFVKYRLFWQNVAPFDRM